MKIDIVKLYSYELKLLRPIVVKGHQVLSRTGYVLELGPGRRAVMVKSLR